MDHYQVLGLTRQASRQDVKEAFRRLARTAHPDKGGSAPAFARLQHAFQILYDPRQRIVYDQVELAPNSADRRRSAQTPPPPPPAPDARAPGPAAAQPPVQGAAKYANLASQLASWKWPGDEDGCVKTTKEEDELAAQGTAHSNAAFEAAPVGGQWGTDGDDEEEGGEGSMPPPGVLEGALLQVLAARGMHVNSATQLVVVCEVCSRPATRTCWVCSADICELCTRALHAKGAWGMHWPLVNAPGSMADRLGRQEFERKRLEDASEYERAQPGFVPRAQRALADAAIEAATRAAVRPDKLLYYDPDVVRFYAWTQTDSAVYLAVHMPFASEATPLSLEVGARGVVCVRAENSSAAPLLHRQLSGALDPGLGLEVMRTPDQQYAVAVLPKAGASSSSSPRWRTLFASTAPPLFHAPVPSGKGAPVSSSHHRSLAAALTRHETSCIKDSRRIPMSSALVACGPDAASRLTGGDLPNWMVGGCEAGGAREMPVGFGPLYRLTCDEDEVCLEVDLPRWVSAADVAVRVWAAGMCVSVGGDEVLHLWRTFRLAGSSTAGSSTSVHAAGSSSPARARPTPVIACEESTWSLSEVTREAKKCKQLTLVMPRARPSGQPPIGRPKPAPAVMVVEDEDEFGLTSLLQAAVFHSSGRVYVQQRAGTSIAAAGTIDAPSCQVAHGRWVSQAHDLPAEARRLLRAMSNARAAGKANTQDLQP